MVIKANSGPAVTFGITLTSTGQVTQYNEDRAPDGSDLGYGLMDPRPFYRYTPGNTNESFNILFDNLAFVDYQPSTASSNGIVSNTQPTASGSVTLTATGAGVTSVSIVAPESGATVNVIAIDGSSASVAYGQSGQVRGWNPRAGTGRTISIVLSSNLDGGSYTIAGRDMYGYPMTETVNTNSSTTITTRKAFKYISAIRASSTVTSTGIIVGYTDTFGMPAIYSYASQANVVTISTGTQGTLSTIALTSANSVLAATATATSSTGDVRGTWSSSVASLTGTVRIQIRQNFDAFQMAQVTNTDNSPIFGQTQFSSV